MFDWNAVNGWEWSTILPDPLHPDIVYSSGTGISKISYPSEQSTNVSPSLDPSVPMRAGAKPPRGTTDMPIAFAPWDRSKLLARLNVLTMTTDAGAHWTTISPDLALRLEAERGNPPRPPGPREAIVGIALSKVAPGTIWVGCNNGLLW